jgi:hypothetical protein
MPFSSIQLTDPGDPTKLEPLPNSHDFVPMAIEAHKYSSDHPDLGQVTLTVEGRAFDVHPNTDPYRTALKIEMHRQDEFFARWSAKKNEED